MLIQISFSNDYSNANQLTYSSVHLQYPHYPYTYYKPIVINYTNAIDILPEFEDNPPLFLLEYNW